MCSSCDMRHTQIPALLALAALAGCELEPESQSSSVPEQPFRLAPDTDPAQVAECIAGLPAAPMDADVAACGLVLGLDGHNPGARERATCRWIPYLICSAINLAVNRGRPYVGSGSQYLCYCTYCSGGWADEACDRGPTPAREGGP